MGDFVELSDLIAPVGGAALPERAGRVDLGGWARMFRVDGERVTVRWEELWAGAQSREVARGDVEGVDVEPDDRSAAGRQTWKVVVHLRGGGTIVPVRRSEKKGLDEGVAKVREMLGLMAATPVPPVLPVLPTSLEDLPGTRYVAMAESGEGMRPIVEGACTTLVASGEDGSVQIRLGEGPPWVLVGAGRTGFWAHAVGVPGEWVGRREMGFEWVVKRIALVRDVPARSSRALERANGGLTWSGVVVEMRDGTRVRVAARLPEAEALAVVKALSGALSLAPTRWARARAYLEERQAETLGPFGGISGDVPVGGAAAGVGAAGGKRRPFVLPYSREPAAAIRVIRGDGVLRVSVPRASFWNGWTRRVILGIPMAVVVCAVAMIVCVDAGRMSVWKAMGVVVPQVALLWLGAAAIPSIGTASELVVADGVLTLERAGGLGRRKQRWPVEDVIDVSEGRFLPTVTALVREKDYGGQLTRREVRLLLWEADADRRRVVEILRAGVGLAPG